MAPYVPPNRERFIVPKKVQYTACHASRLITDGGLDLRICDSSRTVATKHLSVRTTALGRPDIPLAHPRAPSGPRLSGACLQALALSPYTHRRKYRTDLTLSLCSRKRRRRQITLRQGHAETRPVTFPCTYSEATTVAQAPTSAEHTMSRLLPGPSARHTILVVG